MKGGREAHGNGASDEHANLGKREYDVARDEAARLLFARGHPSHCTVAPAADAGPEAAYPPTAWVPLPGDTAAGLFEVLTTACEIKPKKINASSTPGVPAWLEYVRLTPPKGGTALVVLRVAWQEGCPFPLSIPAMCGAYLKPPSGGWKVSTCVLGGSVCACMPRSQHTHASVPNPQHPPSWAACEMSRAWHCAQLHGTVQ